MTHELLLRVIYGYVHHAFAHINSTFKVLIDALTYIIL